MVMFVLPLTSKCGVNCMSAGLHICTEYLQTTSNCNTSISGLKHVSDHCRQSKKPAKPVQAKQHSAKAKVRFYLCFLLRNLPE